VATEMSEEPGSPLLGDLNVPLDHPTIQAAINEAPEGALICVSSGVYREQILLRKVVRLLGLGEKGSTVLEWGGEGATLTASVEASTGPACDGSEGPGCVTVSNMTIVHSGGRSTSPRGSASPGGKDSPRSASPSTSMRFGGALSPGGPRSPRLLTQQREEDRRSATELPKRHNDSIVVWGGQLNLEGCDISSQCGVGVAAVHSGTEVHMTDCVVYQCSSSGILVSQGASAYVEECCCTHNHKNGVSVQGEGSHATLRESQVLHSGKDGVLVSQSTAHIEGCTFAHSNKAGLNAMAGATLTMICSTSRCNRDGLNILDKGGEGTTAELERNVLLENLSDNLYVDKACRSGVAMRHNRK